ncbi:hypothetical protein WAI453_005463 [Rhynchosporium graminicola]
MVAATDGCAPPPYMHSTMPDLKEVKLKVEGDHDFLLEQKKWFDLEVEKFFAKKGIRGPL